MYMTNVIRDDWNVKLIASNIIVFVVITGLAFGVIENTEQSRMLRLNIDLFLISNNEAVFLCLLTRLHKLPSQCY